MCFYYFVLVNREIKRSYVYIVATSQHACVGVVGYRVQVRRHLGSLLATIQIDHLHGIHRQALVRIDRDAKEAGIRLSNIDNLNIDNVFLGKNEKIVKVNFT